MAKATVWVTRLYRAVRHAFGDVAAKGTVDTPLAHGDLAILRAQIAHVNRTRLAPKSVAMTSA